RHARLSPVPARRRPHGRRVRSRSCGCRVWRSGQEIPADVSDLKTDLASLRLENQPERSRKGLWILLGVVIVALGGAALAWRSVTAAVPVSVVTPTVERSGSAPAGTPILTS